MEFQLYQVSSSVSHYNQLMTESSLPHPPSTAADMYNHRTLIHKMGRAGSVTTPLLNHGHLRARHWKRPPRSSIQTSFKLPVLNSSYITKQQNPGEAGRMAQLPQHSPPRGETCPAPSTEGSRLPPGPPRWARESAGTRLTSSRATAMAAPRGTSGTFRPKEVTSGHRPGPLRP